jgi:hypothetical protein
MLPGCAGVGHNIDTNNTNLPARTHKLVFVHASIGQAWLGISMGRLGDTLGDNNYYVSDWLVYNHEDSGLSHDYFHWYNTFADGLNLLSNHNVIESNYSRSISDPGGENDIIMIKPCGSTYMAMGGNPDDSPSGCDPRQAGNNVSDIKQVMLSLLSDIFSQHPEKIFVLLTAPPCPQGVKCGNEQARAIANWMVHDMLDGYDVGNVMVFDLYNVLTSNADGEGNACGPHDTGLQTGNHHRLWNDQVQHQVQYNQLHSGYCRGHPTKDGYYKATVEFVPLLNNFIVSRARKVGQL